MSSWHHTCHHHIHWWYWFCRDDIVRLKNFLSVPLMDSIVVWRHNDTCHLSTFYNDWPVQHFEFYTSGQDQVIQPLRESPIYKEDWIGLQTLDKAKKLKFLSVEGDHLKVKIRWKFSEISMRFWRCRWLMVYSLPMLGSWAISYLTSMEQFLLEKTTHNKYKSIIKQNFIIRVISKRIYLCIFCCGCAAIAFVHAALPMCRKTKKMDIHFDIPFMNNLQTQKRT